MRLILQGILLAILTLLLTTCYGILRTSPAFDKCLLANNDPIVAVHATAWTIAPEFGLELHTVHTVGFALSETWYLNTNKNMIGGYECNGRVRSTNVAHIDPKFCALMRNQEVTIPYVVVCESGWPLRWLRGRIFATVVAWPRGSAAGRCKLISSTSSNAVFVPDVLRKVALNSEQRIIPCGILWAGLAGNLILLASVWVAIIVGISRARRTYRMWRGRCPRCSYILYGTHRNGCPECGWQYGTSKKASTL